MTLDRTLGAISDPTRRQILDRLGSGPASITELARPLDMTLTGLKKHVQILEDARLVVTEKVGRTRQCRLGPSRMDDAFDWIEFYRKQWDRRLDGLEAYFEDKKGNGR
jgi:DNA-binding transcriptional ArsR family regulator